MNAIQSDLVRAQDEVNMAFVYAVIAPIVYRNAAALTRGGERVNG